MEFNKTIKFLAGIIKEVGTTGFIILVLTVIFFGWSTIEQKREFIDRYILFKTMDSNWAYCVIVVLLLVILLISTLQYYKRMLRLEKRTIESLQNEKDELFKLVYKPANKE